MVSSNLFACNALFSVYTEGMNKGANNMGNGIMASYLRGLEMGRNHRNMDNAPDFDRRGLCPYFIDGYNDAYLRGK